MSKLPKIVNKKTNAGLRGMGGGGAFIPWEPSQSVGGILPTIWLKNNIGLFQNTNWTLPCTADGQGCGSWSDQSVNNTGVRAGVGANATTYKIGGLKNLPYLAFNGVDDLLATVAATVISAQCTLFFVYSDYVSGSLLGTSNGGNSPRVRNMTVEPSIANGEPTINLTIPIAGHNLLALTFDYTAKNFYARIDGVAAGQTLNAAFATQPTGTFWLGRGGGEYLSGRIYEVLVYPDVLSAGDIAKTENYLLRNFL
jgi:hypothetical protein